MPKEGPWMKLMDNERAAMEMRANIWKQLGSKGSLRPRGRSELDNSGRYAEHYPYNFHRNSMKDRAASMFRDTLALRARLPNVCNDINGLIERQHANLKTWVREEKNLTHFLETDVDGPKWEDVRIR